MNLNLKGAAIIGALLSTSLTACIDDNYDLSDVDTTVEVKVNDLTLPTTIDPIYLKNIIDNDGTDIKVINGEYAIEQTGTFHSEELKVNPIFLAKPELPAVTNPIVTSGVAAAIGLSGKASLYLSSKEVTFEYHTSNVSSEIISIDAIGTVYTIDITMGFDGFNGSVNGITYNDIVIRLPKGMEVDKAKTDGSYDDATGLLTVDSRKAGADTKTVIHVAATSIDKRSGYTYKNPEIWFTDQLQLVSATAVLTSADVVGDGSSIPSQVDFVTHFDMSEIDVTTFTGEMVKDIKGMNMPSVNLSSLPSFLSQEGTDIRLVNPQIYLTLNNPAGPFGLEASSGLSITPYRGSVASEPCELPAGSIKVPATATATEKVEFCLSPSQPLAYYPGYTKPIFEAYPSLARVLQGTGIPSMLKVELLSPMIPRQTVRNYPVGTSIGTVEGTYRFFTPLDVAADSHVVYSSREDGWWSEDLDHLTITRLHVKALVSTDTPLAVTLSGYPIDRFGNQINGVQIEGAVIDPAAKEQPVDIYITGNVTGLDGIVFTAVVKADSEATLTEETTIVITDLRATASGYYVKEL